MNTNQKAVLEHGWGPKALNNNVLCHPEIESSKPQGDNAAEKMITLVSYLRPSELNLTSGLSGTLIERIVMQSNKEARASGASVAEMVAKCQATTRKTLENHEKRFSAGLIAGAGMLKLNEEILGFAKRAKEAQDAKQCEKQQ